MASRIQSPRERAARVLCDQSGLAPDTQIEGRAAWRSFLPAVDAVVRIIFGEEVVIALTTLDQAGTV